MELRHGATSGQADVGNQSFYWSPGETNHSGGQMKRTEEVFDDPDDSRDLVGSWGQEVSIERSFEAR